MRYYLNRVTFFLAAEIVFCLTMIIGILYLSPKIPAPKLKTLIDTILLISFLATLYINTLSLVWLQVFSVFIMGSAFMMILIRFLGVGNWWAYPLWVFDPGFITRDPALHKAMIAAMIAVGLLWGNSLKVAFFAVDAYVDQLETWGLVGE